VTEELPELERDLDRAPMPEPWWIRRLGDLRDQRRRVLLVLGVGGVVLVLLLAA
jgi:hypothetical protein